jgi:hypothetical protein
MKKILLAAALLLLPTVTMAATDTPRCPSKTIAVWERFPAKNPDDNLIDPIAISGNYLKLLNDIQEKYNPVWISPMTTIDETLSIGKFNEFEIRMKFSSEGQALKVLQEYPDAPGNYLGVFCYTKE